MTNASEKSADHPHYCEDGLNRDGYGPAIDHCRERPDGTLWAGNDEYLSQVAYCRSF